ncbi:MAG: hypothetical protein GX605_01230, partial [Chloroflexi bacterium]|nr:hypothetical protein [Chloroflexota bacterium]
MVELGDRYLPGERIHLVVELTGPPDTVVATQWYEPQGQSVIAEMEYELAPDFTGCVHFDLQPVQPDEIPLGAYRVEVLLNGEPLQRAEFHIEVPQEGPAGWGGRIRYRFPSGLFSLDRFSGWAVEEGDGTVRFGAADGSLTWETSFVVGDDRVEPVELEEVA